MADIETCLESVTGAAMRKAERDRLIRLAVVMLPASEPYEQAGILASEAKALARTWNASGCRNVVNVPTKARECLQMAAQIAELPSSQRQFYRVLTKPSN